MRALAHITVSVLRIASTVLETRTLAHEFECDVALKSVPCVCMHGNKALVGYSAARPNN